MEFTSDNLVKAVLEFYNHEESLNIECHEWLKNCQSSRQAWTLVWPLLESSQVIHVQFMSANILHYKVSRQLTELPVEDYLALKDNLVAAVARYINGPSVVLTRLQLTLGVFIANTIGQIWPNPLEDLAAVFQPHNFPGVPDESVTKLLIQVFGYVPEQAQSVWQHSSRKSEAHRELQSKGESMFNWLFTIVQSQQNIELIKEALRAMTLWMKMLSICEWRDMSNLLDLLVNLCKDSIRLGDFSLCDLCLEMLSGIICDPNTHHFPTVILMILDKIIPLEPTLEVILELRDMEMAGSFYGMYVALAECHSRLVVEVCDEDCSHNKANPKNRANMLKLVDILLRCAATAGAYPIDETVSSITISVWYSFVEDIQPKQSEGLKYARLMQVFEWVYKSLGEILVKKARFPLDDSDWNAEEKEQFRIYRQDVCDCLTYCFELRGWTMLNEMIDAAEQQLSVIKNPENLSTLWPELESLLMGIRAVTENISNETDPLLIEPMTRAFNIVIKILKLNQLFRMPKVYQAAAECISSCSGMLHLFENAVRNLIGFILEGLFIPESSSSATLTLKSLSRDCTKLLAEFTPQILSSCKQALDSGVMSQNDSIRLVFCIGKFLPYLPHEQIITAVNEIFAPSLLNLHGIAGEEPRAETRHQLIVILRIMSTLCSSLDVDDRDSEEEEEEDMSSSEPVVPGDNNNYSSQNRVDSPAGPSGSSARTSGSRVIEEVNPNVKPRKLRDLSSQPLIPVVEQILPVLVPLAEKWSRDEEVMETLFSILKHTLGTIHASSQIVIDFGIKLVLISYRLHPVPPATHLAKQILLMLGRENFHSQCQFLKEIHLLCSDTLKNPRENLDFVESYFSFIGQLVRQQTELVNASTINIDSMLSMSIDILNYTEAPLLKAGIFFVQVTLEKAGSLTPPLVEFYRSHGPLLLHTVILAIGCSVPRSSVHHFSEIFIFLNKTFAGEWRKWLQDALSPPGFPSPHCSVDAKNKFFMKLAKDRATKRTIADAITDFALACRNMSGSEYASATSKRM